MARWKMLAAAGGVVLGLLAAVPVSRAESDTIKVGYVDPFSGPFAAGGDQFLKVPTSLPTRSAISGTSVLRRMWSSARWRE